MRRFGLLLAAAVLAGVAASHDFGRTAAQPPAPEGDAAAGIRKNAADYTKAFNAGDATAAATSWTADGEYTDTDGETHRGRAAIAAELTAFFKAHPKATVEIVVENVRPLGRGTAHAEGTVKVRVPTEPEPMLARFGGVFVREDDGWKIATIRDTPSDPATDVTVADLGWFVGDWAAKGSGGDLKIGYAWDEGKTFLTGTYTITKDGKAVAGGKQIIGTNPAGGLRSWVFDGSGTTGDGLWTRDGNRWLVEAAGVLPDGTETTAVNVMIPLGPDAFTWQPTERTAGGVALPDQPPVRVTRVKK